MESARCAGVKTTPLTNGERLSSDDLKLLTFSAHTADALRSVVQSHEKYLQAHPESIDDLQYTLAVRREHMAHRTFSVVSAGLPDSSLNLAQFRKPHANPLTVWTFTGQGAQWAQMGARLILEDNDFKSTIQKLEKVLRKCEPSPSWSLEGKCVLMSPPNCPGLRYANTTSIRGASQASQDEPSFRGRILSAVLHGGPGSACRHAWALGY